jgi:hypothetical protein
MLILQKVWGYDDYIRVKAKATGKLDFSSYEKSTAVVQMLAYGIVVDLIDEYTSRKTLIVKFLLVVHRINDTPLL